VRTRSTTTCATRRLVPTSEREGTFMAGLKLNVARVVALAGLLIAGVGVSAALAAPSTPNGNGGPQTTVPGSPGDDCSHGNNGKDCRPDPNENGQDCDDHGNARGNEDHCSPAETTTTTPSTSTTTTTTDTTPSTSTTTTTTSSSTTTTTTSQTSTTSTGGGNPPPTTTTPAAPPAAPAGTAAPAASEPATKPELQQELAQQIKGKQAARVSPAARNPGELPFTGFPAWALALVGSTMLATGLGLRKLGS
jgi:hypothetical protein